LQVPQNAPVRRSKFSGVACYSQVHENASEAKLSKKKEASTELCGNLF